MDILLVDDDALDRELFTEAIQVVGPQFSVIEAENGEKALEYLSASGPLPQLIILDLNMPVMDGRATLKELKNHHKHKLIPICILSTSAAQFDISGAYENGASLFLVKPLEFKRLVEMLTHLLTLFEKYVSLSKSGNTNS